jgi:hypothetical protein
VVGAKTRRGKQSTLVRSTTYQNHLLVFLAMIYRHLITPYLWHVSWGIPIDKHNAKEKCAAFRLVHLLDPMAKDWLGINWARCRCRFAANSYGFIVCRRREQAVLLMRLLRWRLHRLNLCSISAFWDMSNAFPSMAWGRLDAAVDECASLVDGWFQKTRYRRDVVLVQGPESMITAVRAFSGDRQGDVSAPQKFVLAFDPAVEDFDIRARNWADELFLTLCEPCTNLISSSSLVRFADDVARLGCCFLPQGALDRIRFWNDELQKVLAPCQIAQNINKQQLLIEWGGKGSRRAAWTTRNLLQQQNFEWRGKAIHLGLWHELGMRTEAEITFRLSSAQKAWASYRRFWNVQSISVKLRRQVYIAAVLASLLAGLEVAALNKCQQKRIEVFHCKRMRVILHGEARNHSNQWVRQRLDIASTDSLLRVRRLVFLRSLLSQPYYYVQLLAALAGHTLDGNNKQLDGRGWPIQSANPWL